MLAGDSEDAERRPTCRWLMKRIVRSAFEAVMPEVGDYGRDIHPCAAAAAEHRPERAEAIWRAAALAVGPTAGRVVIAAVADPPVGWLREERTARVAGHPTQADTRPTG